MIKYLSILFFLFFALSATAQIRQGEITTLENRFIDNPEDSTRISTKEIKIKLSGKTHFTDYKVINYKNDTSYIDTTLNINNDYKFNYSRKDKLEYIAFANQGQTYNTLAYTFNPNSLYPKIGARAQHFNFYEVEDIHYYYVPTPTTQLMYRTGMEQGQVLDAIFTFNTSKQLNASISFKGMRSLGHYRHALSDHGNLRVTLNYHTKNNRYSIKTHIVAQDLYNDQNGGLTTESILNFENGDSEFKDRNRLITNFTDAKNGLRGNRYFIDHYYKIWNRIDTLKSKSSNLKIGHVFNYERKNYEYKQGVATPLIFGTAFNSTINDKLKYTKFFNEVYLSLTSPITLGEVIFKVNNFDFDYKYKSILISDNDFIDSNLNGNSIAIGGEWHTKFKKFNLDVDASTIISGDLNGHNILAEISYEKDSLFSVKAGAFRNSKLPNFNFILNQSTYKKYNWQNDFNNEETIGLNFEFDAKKWIYATIQMTNINNYTYFDAPQLGQTKPVQANETVNYLKVKLGKEFRLGHFALDNQFIYQNVSGGSEILHVPSFITRNTFYYLNNLFKGKPLYLETGVTFTYFSKYYMNNYNPVISEFYLQNDAEYGGYPMFDFFLNLRIRTMKIYFKLEHFNSSFGEYNYYSAPTYPYRDFTVRFGVVWTFFI